MSDTLEKQGYKRYRKRLGNEVVAVRLDLDTDGFSYTKWGSTQRCKAGDWLVTNGDDTYTVDGDTFADTYEKVDEGRYRKTGIVWAKQAEQAGKVKTHEGETAYEAGDYIISNDNYGSDRYSASKSKFERMYVPVK